MAGGIVCFILYMLLTLRQPAPLSVQWGGILFYVGIVALPLGAILFLFGEMKR